MQTKTEKRVIQLDLELGGYTSEIDRLKKQLSGLNVEARKASKSLDGIEKSSKKTNTELKSMNKTMGRTLENSRALNRAINSLRNVFAALFALRLAEGFISEIQAVDNQLKTVTNSTEEFAAAQEQLLGVAREVRQSYEGTVKLYARITRANDELGLSQEQIVKITTNIGKALAAQGASAQEARSALLQISQAFGSGVLAGEEFRAVAESAPILLQDLADSLGVARGELKGMAADGKLTADVIAKAWETAGRSTAAFNKTLPTLGGALQVLADQFRDFVRDINEGTGAFGALASAVLVLSDNIEVLSILLGSLAIGAALKSMTGWAAATLAAAGGTAKLNTALAAMGAYGFTAAEAAAALTVAFNKFGRVTGYAAILYTLIEIKSQIDAATESLESSEDAWDIFFTNANANALELASSLAEVIPPLLLLNVLSKGIDLAFGGEGLGFLDRLEAQADAARKRVDDLVISIGNARYERNKARAERDAGSAPPPGALSKSELEAIGKAYQSVTAAMDDLQLQITANNMGMSLAEAQFRALAGEADISGSALEQLVKNWKEMRAEIEAAKDLDAAILSFNNAVEDAKTPLEKYNEQVREMTAASQAAGDDGTKLAVVLGKMRKEYIDSTKEQQAFNAAMEELETPADKFAANLKLISESQGYLALSTGEQIRLLTTLSQQYYDSTDAAKAFAEEQERLAEIQKSIVDSTRGGILANRDSALSDLDKVQENLPRDEQGNQDLEQLQAIQAQRVLIHQEANQQIIENGTETMQIMGALAEDFSAGLGDAIVTAATEGEDAFADFAKSFAQQIASMAVELLVIIPLLQAFKTLIAGTGGGGGDFLSSTSTSDIFSGNFAKGGGFAKSGNVIPFAKGGVLNQPTPFMFAKGGAPALGVAGEAGAEAILPLSRGSDGVLGVQSSPVNVVVNNNAPGVNVSAQQSEEGLTIDVVMSSIAASIERGGNPVSDAMERNYSLGRGGSLY